MKGPAAECLKRRWPIRGQLEGDKRARPIRPQNPRSRQAHSAEAADHGRRAIRLADRRSHVQHRLCRLHVTSRGRFDLDVGIEAQLPYKPERRFEARELFAGKGGRKPAADIEQARLIVVCLGHQGVHTGQPFQIVVVEKDRSAVAGQHDIELDPGDTELGCPADRRECVLRR